MKRSEQLGVWRPYHRAVKRYRMGFVRAGIGLAVLLAGWLGGCSDDPSGPCSDCPPPPQGLIVSDPTSAASITAGMGTLAARAAGAAEDMAYVSLPPGTVPAGSVATIRRLGDAGPIFATVRNGGFDPVPVEAQAGDSIEVLVRDASGTTLANLRLMVAAARPPIVVRTDPPRRKTHVPLNAPIVIVFSEPIAEGTLSASSVRLFRGLFPVAGTVRLLQGTGAAAAFIPAAPLARNSDYRLVVTRGVRDLEGDALEAGVTVAFTTGQSSTGPAASITVSPDSVYMAAATYQMTATVRDGAGNELIDQPVTWATSDPSGLTVSPTGLLTALAAGSYFVTATVNGVSGQAFVYVRGGAPASMTLAPASATVGAGGDTIILTATVRDPAGLLIYPSVTWTSSDPAVATVAGAYLDGSAYATVTGVTLGSVVVTATSGTASPTASITVTTPPPVASLTISPGSATLLLRAMSQLSVTLRDANGRVLTGRRSVAWNTSDATVATVDTTGLVTAVSVGSAFMSAASDGVGGTAAITVRTLGFFRSVSAGSVYTCALTTSGAAYCWGASGPRLGGGDSGVTVPVAVSGGLTFSSLSAGSVHTCGVTTTGAAHCWGGNASGELGTGSSDASWVPVRVTGGLAFSAVSAGGFDLGSTCGLTTSGTAYCWGTNVAGMLGIGYRVGPELCDGWSCSPTPLAVIYGLTFSRLGAGGWHRCGLATNGNAYCWGTNSYGELGIGSATGPEDCQGSPACSTRPVLVAGGLVFSELDVGSGHTCGLTTDGTAYCWGINLEGELGIGSNTGPEQCPYGVPCSTRPLAVAGGLTFSALSAGGSQTCGLTAAGAAYCWGGSYGSLPVAVPGGLTFSALSTGGGHACGMTVAGVLYCWGSNGAGQLGNSTTIDSSVPVRVAGQP